MKRSIAASVVLALLASACITIAPGATPDTDPAIEPAGSETPAPGSERAGEQRSPDGGGGAGNEREESPFGPRDVPPGGFEALLGFVPGGGIEGPCVTSPPDVPPGVPGVSMRTFEIPTSLCAIGLAAGEPAEVTLTGPGGRKWTDRVRPDSDGEVEWNFQQLPRRLEGPYVVEVTQNGIDVEETFNVRVEELDAVVVPRFISPGDTTELAIAGGEPGAVLPAYLYAERTPGSNDWDFMADLGRLKLNDRGQARLDLRSRRRDEERRYTVVVDPAGAKVGFWFALGQWDTGEQPPEEDSSDEEGEEDGSSDEEGEEDGSSDEEGEEDGSSDEEGEEDGSSDEEGAP